MHAHVQGCLDIGMCAAYLHRGRATDSRMHARGLAAVFMQCDIVLLDSATAMLRHVIVRCQGPNSRRQRSCTRAQLRSNDGAMGVHLSGGEGRAWTESALD